MKYTLFKKNDLQKVLLIALAFVGFSSYVFSAPPGPTPASGDVVPLINASNTAQSKNCSGVGLLNTTLSLCHDGGTPTQGFATESLVSQGPIIAEGALIADLSQAVASLVPTPASPFFDALRLTTGKNQNITTITLGSSGPAILGVWSDFLADFAQGRFGRLDAEKLILTEKNSFASWTFGPLRTPANEFRTTSYTSTVGALPNIDIAGTTNLGHGNYCYRGYRDCSGGANSDGGGNMYISRVGRNYTTCRDIDPAEFPQVDDMTDPGYFTCDEDRTAPAARVSTLIRLMPSYGFGYTSTSGNLCVGNSYNTSIVSLTGGHHVPVYMDADDTFNFGTMVFSDPYLERPVVDGWHAGGFANATNLPDYGQSVNEKWFETKRGAVTRIGQCTTAPTGVTFYSPYSMYLYNE